MKSTTFKIWLSAIALFWGVMIVGGMLASPHHAIGLLGIPVAIGVIVLAISIYFLPYINARERLHPNAGAIFVINLFLGWTLLGWVGALAWSCTETSGRNPAIN